MSFISSRIFFFRLCLFFFHVEVSFVREWFVCCPFRYLFVMCVCHWVIFVSLIRRVNYLFDLIVVWSLAKLFHCNVLQTDTNHFSNVLRCRIIIIKQMKNLPICLHSHILLHQFSAALFILLLLHLPNISEVLVCNEALKQVEEF